MARSKATPSGIVEMTPEEEQEFLDTLPGPPPPQTVFTTLEFLNRLTAQERADVRTHAGNNPASDVADWIERVRAATEIDIEDARTAAGLQTVVDAGLLTSDRRDEILTP